MLHQALFLLKSSSQPFVPQNLEQGDLNQVQEDNLSWKYSQEVFIQNHIRQYQSSHGLTYVLRDLRQYHESA